VQDVLFYGPPDHAQYYSELVNLLESGFGGVGRMGYVCCGVKIVVRFIECLLFVCRGKQELVLGVH
jgi:hypothetical protein